MPEPIPTPGYSSMEMRQRARHENESEDSSWGEEVENYIRKLLDKCEVATEAHEKCGYSAKANHTRFSFPTMLLPAISAPIMGVFKDAYWVIYFGMCSMVLTAFFSTFSTFFNYGEKSQKHFNFSGRYADIVTDIEETLAKDVSKRAGGSVVMRTYKMKYDALMLNSPET